MHPRFRHPSAAQQSNHPAGTALTKSASLASDVPDLVAALASAERACCCLAKPMVMVVLPPSARRPHPVDLLLCGHHFHVSEHALISAGAAVYDSRTLTNETAESSEDTVGAR